MKILFYNLITFLILNSFTLTKEECQDNEISISALGKCKKISEILGNIDLNLKTLNLLYLASNDDGKIDKDGYKLEIYKLSDTRLQSHMMRKSKLYIPYSCLEKMEQPKHFGLNRNRAIVIIVYNSHNFNKNHITDNYFIILHTDANEVTKYITSKTDDFSFCHEDPILFEDEVNIADLRYSENDNTPINMEKILYGRKYGIDLFNPYSNFLNDICFKFTSEKGSDVPLESRVEDYYQNISFCDDRENSHYLSYNYSETKKTFTYRCAFGFYKNEEDKSSYLDIIDNELKSLVSVSNIKVITCYKTFLNLKDIITNYGGMICIIVLIIQIVCFLIFCLYGIKPIEDKLDDLFILGKVIIRRLTNWKGFNFDLNQDNNANNDQMPRKKFNLWGQIKKMRERRLKLEQQKKEKEKGKSHPPKKIRNSKAKIDSEEIKIYIKDINDNDNGNDNDNDDSNKKKSKENNETKNEIKSEKKSKSKKSKSKNKNKNKKDKSTKKDKVKKENKKSEGNQLITLDENKKDIKIKPQEDSSDKDSNNATRINNSKNNEEKNEKLVLIKDNSKLIYKKKEKENSKQTDDKQENDDKTSDKDKDKDQLYDYDDDELNEMPIDKVLKYDNRSFCRYYGSILVFSHIILNVFFRHNDYNLFTVKLGLLFMTFPINITMNIFFFTNKNIKLSYIRNMDDISSFWSNIANTVYSSILANALLIILKLICLTHNSVRQLRKNKNVESAQIESVCVLRCIKVRIIIYYILSFAFLLVFGFYVLSFCAIFENTQIELVKSTFTSWLISLLYPFIICFITSIIRSAAKKCKSSCLNGVKKIMQFL